MYQAAFHGCLIKCKEHNNQKLLLILNNTTKTRTS